MPGFPFSSSSKFLTGLFLTPQSAGSTDLNLRVYTSNATSTLGLFPKASTGNTFAYGDLSATTSSIWVAPSAGYAAASTAGNAVDLYIGLIKGTNTSVLDDNFADTTGVIGAGSVTNAGIGEADYSGYKRVRITSTTGSAGAGTAFSAITGTVAAGTKVSSISINTQLQFPACQTGAGGANANAGSAVTNTIVGFFISSNPKTQNQDSPASIDIIAYGALSSTRSITANDTPVFTSGAITITLD